MRIDFRDGIDKTLFVKVLCTQHTITATAHFHVTAAARAVQAPSADALLMLLLLPACTPRTCQHERIHTLLRMRSTPSHPTGTSWCVPSTSTAAAPWRLAHAPASLACPLACWASRCAGAMLGVLLMALLVVLLVVLRGCVLLGGCSHSLHGLQPCCWACSLSKQNSQSSPTPQSTHKHTHTYHCVQLQRT